MQKSVYSLVLSDGIVAEVDRLAYERGASRSNMINEILAEYVSIPTPEKRMREVFGRLERMMSGGTAFEQLLQPSDAMFSVRSVLSYKYNPAIKYSVELYRDQRPELGELRVSVRSQNATLMLTMLQFFKLWTRMEQSYIGPTEYAVEEGRYVRRFRYPEGENIKNEDIGEAIASYIDAFDRAIKLYFDNLTTPQYAVSGVESVYAGYVRGCGFIL